MCNIWHKLFKISNAHPQHKLKKFSSYAGAELPDDLLRLPLVECVKTWLDNVRCN